MDIYSSNLITSSKTINEITILTHFLLYGKGCHFSRIGIYFFFIFEYVCFNEIVLGKTAHDPHVKPLHKRFMLIAT